VKGALSFILHGGGATVGIHGPEGGVTRANNEFGIALVMILPLCSYQWHLADNRHLRRGLTVMGFLVSLAVIFTYSRGALLALCAMGALLWLRSRAKFCDWSFSFSRSDCSFTVSCPSTGSPNGRR